MAEKQIQKQVAPNVASTLQGRIPGVEILQKGGEAGADVKILVRGAGTFGETEPLYVIDGAFSNNIESTIFIYGLCWYYINCCYTWTYI